MSPAWGVRRLVPRHSLPLPFFARLRTPAVHRARRALRSSESAVPPLFFPSAAGRGRAARGRRPASSGEGREAPDGAGASPTVLVPAAVSLCYRIPVRRPIPPFDPERRRPAVPLRRRRSRRSGHRLYLPGCLPILPAAYRRMALIVYRIVPAGTWTVTVSPFRFPRRARPTGDSLLMRSFEGSASADPTIV